MRYNFAYSILTWLHVGMQKDPVKEVALALTLFNKGIEGDSFMNKIWMGSIVKMEVWGGLIM